MFFDKLGGGAGMGPGMAGGAAGLTSPGMNPQSLAALMAMFGGGSGGGGMMGGPTIPMPPARPAMGAAIPPIPAPPQPQAAAPVAMPAMPSAGGQQPNLMQMLAKLDPTQLQALLARLGMGGGGQTFPGVPLYPPGSGNI